MQTLVVDVPSRIARRIVVTVLPAFLECHPKLKVDVRADDRMVDLVEEGVDCAIRVGPLQPSTLVAHPLGSLKLTTCAARPTWLRDHRYVSLRTCALMWWCGTKLNTPPITAARSWIIRTRTKALKVCRCPAASACARRKRISPARSHAETWSRYCLNGARPRCQCTRFTRTAGIYRREFGRLWHGLKRCCRTLSNDPADDHLASQHKSFLT